MARRFAVVFAVPFLLLAACGERTPSGGAASSAPAVALLPPDAVRGKAVFARCQVCHTAFKGGENMTGPNLYGVIGRPIASAPGYAYSDGLKAKTGVWDETRLDAWLTEPRKFAPGTRMAFIGLEERQDRLDVIAYLKSIGPAAKP